MNTSLKYMPQVDEISNTIETIPESTANINDTSTDTTAGEIRQNLSKETQTATVLIDLNTIPLQDGNAGASVRYVNDANSSIFYISNNPNSRNAINQLNYDLPQLPVEPLPKRKAKVDLIELCNNFFCAILTFILLALLINVALGNGSIIDSLFPRNSKQKTTTSRPPGTTAFYNGTIPMPTKCGIPYYQPNSQDMNIILAKRDISGQRKKRIINGKEAVAHSWPWMVSIRTRYFSSHFCDGFLIYEQFVLTAAHCLEGKSADEIIVVVGLHDVNDYSNDQIYLVDSIAINEIFDSKRILNDIGIIKLRKPVELSENVGLICLPDLTTDPNHIYNNLAVLAGWGRIDTDGSNILATTLQETVLKVFSASEYPCDNQDYNPNIIYCVADAQRNEYSNACSGDSGSPLFVQVNGKWYVYGITSYINGVDNGNGVVICVSSEPSYFTKVPLYLKWIAQKVTTM